jgi:hypothetical protein
LFEVACTKKIYKPRLAAGAAQPMDWNPLHVSAAHLDATENPTGQPLDLFISQDISNAMMRVIDAELKTLMQWEGGVGLKRAIDYSSDDPAAPERFVAILQKLLNQCQPQADVSMMGSRLGKNTSTLLFFAGPPEISSDLLKSHSQAVWINRALTFESHRMGMISYSYPVSLAGMPRIQSVFRQAYEAYFDQWRGNPQKLEEERRKLHCFPRSWEWRDPWELDEPPDPAHEALAQAILVSWVLETDFTPAPSRKLFDNIVQEMHKANPAPRSKALSAFVAAGTEIWVAPFCAPDLAKSTFSDAGQPLKLGADLVAAMTALPRGPAAEIREHISQWVNWFSENKSALFEDEDLPKVRKQMIEKAREHLNRATQEHRPRWTLVLQQAQGPFIYQA